MQLSVDYLTYLQFKRDNSYYFMGISCTNFFSHLVLEFKFTNRIKNN